MYVFQDHGVSYKLKHVDEYGMDHRLVGAKGIRLKVSIWYIDLHYRDLKNIICNWRIH